MPKKTAPASKRQRRPKAAPSARSESIQELMARAIQAKHGAKSAVYLGAGAALSEVSEVIPFRIDAVDRHVIGIGGLPGGRVIELASEEGGGKTTLGWSAIASVQREGGLGIYVDAEKAVSRNRCETMGASWKDTLMLQPTTLEEGLDQVWTSLELIPRGSGPNLIVFDSVVGAPTLHELKTGEMSVGEIARVLTTKLRRVGRLLIERRTTLLMINQVRDTIGGWKSGTLKTPGGRYFGHAASLRLMLFGGAKVEVDGKRVGKDITIQAFKNRFVEPFRKVRARLLFDAGWDNVWTTITYAKEEGVVSSKKRPSTRLYLEACQKLGWTAVHPKTGEVIEPAAAAAAVAEEPEDPELEEYEREDADDDQDEGQVDD